jgi:hypothetical protein
VAFDSYFAALSGYFASNLSLASKLPLDDLATAVTISRDINQASTLDITVEDQYRTVLNSPVANQASRIAISGISFVLVKVGKRQNQTRLVFEDSVVAKLRTMKGPLAAAPNVCTRVDFAYQLVRQAGIRFIGAPNTPRAKEPLSRGTSSDAQEDSWTCLVRIAQEVGYRCFSDGTSVIFGPDDWLFQAYKNPVMHIQEYTNGIDFIDLTDWDVGKPLAECTVYTYAPQWHGDLGAIIAVEGMGPGTNYWMVSKIDRDLYHTPATITMIRPQPTLPEPVNTT